MKVNAEHSSYGTLNSGKNKKVKQKICHDAETYIVGTILPIDYIYMLIQAFVQLYVKSN
jgi:hypothetical protein